STHSGRISHSSSRRMMRRMARSSRAQASPSANAAASMTSTSATHTSSAGGGGMELGRSPIGRYADGRCTEGSALLNGTSSSALEASAAADSTFGSAMGEEPIAVAAPARVGIGAKRRLRYENPQQQVSGRNAD